MTKRKAEKRPEREWLNWCQQCDGGDTQRNHYVRECVGETYDERFHEWLRR